MPSSGETALSQSSTDHGIPGTGAAPADETLAARARRGDLAALSDLLSRWTARLTSFCRRLVGHDEDARDLAQDALLKATRALDRYDPSRPFAPWIYRIARNTALNHIERRRIRSKTPPAMDRAEPTPDVLVARREEVLRVRRALDQLGPEDRRVLEMKLVRNLDNREIARRLGIGRGALRTRACRALARLRAALDEEKEAGR